MGALDPWRNGLQMNSSEGEYEGIDLEEGEPMYNIQLTDPMTHRLPVTDLEISPEGNLWARRGSEDESFFDIWSPDGDLIGSAVLPGVGHRSRSWKFEVCDKGILAYDIDPAFYQAIYLIGIPHRQLHPER